MKILLYSIILLVCMTTSSAQTKLKPAPLSTLSYGSRTLSLDDTTIWAPREQKNFMLGWQWQGPSANTNKRLHCNFYHDHFGGSGTRKLNMKLIPDSGAVKYLAWQHLQLSNGDYYCVMGNQRGFQFELTGLTVKDENNPIRTCDTTGGVFGFNVRDTIFLS